MWPYYRGIILFYLPRVYVSHYKAIYYTFILTGTVLATSCLRLDMTSTAKNITKSDDVEIKELRHTADLHVHVALLKVSIVVYVSCFVVLFSFSILIVCLGLGLVLLGVVMILLVFILLLLLFLCVLVLVGLCRFPC